MVLACVVVVGCSARCLGVSRCCWICSVSDVRCPRWSEMLGPFWFFGAGGRVSSATSGMVARVKVGGVLSGFRSCGVGVISVWLFWQSVWNVSSVAVVSFGP